MSGGAGEGLILSGTRFVLSAMIPTQSQVYILHRFIRTCSGHQLSTTRGLLFLHACRTHGQWHLLRKLEWHENSLSQPTISKELVCCLCGVLYKWLLLDRYVHALTFTQRLRQISIPSQPVGRLSEALYKWLQLLRNIACMCSVAMSQNQSCTASKKERRKNLVMIMLQVQIDSWQE